MNPTLRGKLESAIEMLVTLAPTAPPAAALNYAQAALAAAQTIRELEGIAAAFPNAPSYAPPTE